MTEVALAPVVAVGYRRQKERDMPRMRRIPAAEAMPVEDETRQFIQQVRRTTRRKRTEESEQR